MTAAVTVLAVALVVALIPRAYRCGRGAGGPSLSCALLAELRVHKLVCLGEPAAHVALELSALAGADALVNRQERDAPRACGHAGSPR
jgi:hypothetical protein